MYGAHHLATVRVEGLVVSVGGHQRKDDRGIEGIGMMRKGWRRKGWRRKGQKRKGQRKKGWRKKGWRRKGQRRKGQRRKGLFYRIFLWVLRCFEYLDIL